MKRNAKKVRSNGHGTAKLKTPTKSFRLYAVFRKQHGKATVEQLAKAIGVDTPFVSFYMGELKRVYGIEFTHEKGSPDYQVSNLKIAIPPNGSRGRMRWQRRNRGIRASRRVLVASAGGTPPNGLDAALDQIKSEIDQKLDAFRSMVKDQLMQGQSSVAIPVAIFDKLKTSGRVSKQDLRLLTAH